MVNLLYGCSFRECPFEESSVTLEKYRSRALSLGVREAPSSLEEVARLGETVDQEVPRVEYGDRLKCNQGQSCLFGLALASSSKNPVGEVPAYPCEASLRNGQKK